jgi:hypothetical protein
MLVGPAAFNELVVYDRQHTWHPGEWGWTALSDQERQVQGHKDRHNGTSTRFAKMDGREGRAGREDGAQESGCEDPERHQHQGLGRSA